MLLNILDITPEDFFPSSSSPNGRSNIPGIRTDVSDRWLTTLARHLAHTGFPAVR
jgi:hypothetical protein